MASFSALLKLFVGQHILNGVSVAAGVMAVSFVASALFGFEAGQPATLGAISASISDQPAPLRRKALLMAVGFGIAIFSTLTLQLVSGVAYALIPAIACHRLSRRPRDRLWPLGAGAQHAGAGADGVRARPAADELCRRAAQRSAC